jgi:chromosome segregation ATPase
MLGSRPFHIPRGHVQRLCGLPPRSCCTLLRARAASSMRRGQQMSACRLRAGSASKELESTRRQLEKAQASAAHAQDRVVTLEAVCSAKEQAVEGLTHESRRAADQLAAFEGQVGELQRQLRGQQAGHEVACKELGACRSQLQQEQQSGAARLAEHDEQRATAAALAAGLEGQVRLLRDESAEGKAALEAAGGRVQQLEAAKLVLEQQLQGAGALVAGLEQQLRVLAEEGEQDQAALQEAGLRMQHLAEFKEGLEEQLRAAGSAHAEQQQQLHALGEENARAKAALEAAGLRARELDAANEGLEQRLDASLALVANLEQQLELLGEECRQDKAALEDAGLNTQQLVEARMALQEQLLAAGSRHAELEGQQRASAALAADLQRRLEVLGEESKRDKAALEDAGLRIQRLQEAKGELEQQLEDSEEGCGVVSDKVRMLHAAALHDPGSQGSCASVGRRAGCQKL